MLLTIAIPTYNRALFLDELLQCLHPTRHMRQAHLMEFEILILDNASSDDTVNVCKRNSGEIANCRVIRQVRNVGFPMNLACGFENAKGKYVWTLCDDDLIDAYIIPEILLELTKHGNASAFLLNRDIYDVTMKQLLDGNCLRERGVRIFSDWDGKLNYIGHLLTASCTILNREAASLGFSHKTFSGTYCETMVLAIHALMKGNLVLLGQFSIRYREGNNGNWNALWPWIYFYNMPMVVHELLDEPGRWDWSNLFVSKRSNDLFYNLCYLRSSRSDIIRSGFSFLNIKHIYGVLFFYFLTDFIVVKSPVFFSRMYVYFIGALRSLRRSIVNANSIFELLGWPARAWNKYKKFRLKETC